MLDALGKLLLFPFQLLLALIEIIGRTMALLLGLGLFGVGALFCFMGPLILIGAPFCLLGLLIVIKAV